MDKVQDRISLLKEELVELRDELDRDSTSPHQILRLIEAINARVKDLNSLERSLEILHLG